MEGPDPRRPLAALRPMGRDVTAQARSVVRPSSSEARLPPLALFDLKVSEGMTDEQADAYVTEVHGPAPSGKVDTPGIVRGTALAALSQVPFADELGAAIKAVPRLVPGGQSFGEAYDEGKEAFAEGVDAYGSREGHPVLSALTKIGSVIGGAAASAPLGVVKGSALVGGLTAAGSGEGVGDRLLRGTAGAAIGAGLGKGAEKVMGLGGRKALGLLGGAGGATYGDSGPEHAVGAAGGVGAGYMAGRMGGAVVSRIGDRILSRGPLATLRARDATQAARQALAEGSIGIDAASAEPVASGLGGTLRRAVLPSSDELGFGKIAQAFGREGITPEMVEAFPGNAGDIALDIGKVKGPLQRLGQTVVSYPSEGSTALGSRVAERAAFAPTAAEKSARKALGSRYVPENPIVTEAQAAIDEIADPLFAQLEGKVVRSPEVLEFLRTKQAREVYKEAQDLMQDAVDFKLPGAQPLPDLVTLADDGSEVFVTEIPAKALHLMKRGLRSMVESRRTSANPISSDRAALLGSQLSKVIGAARLEVPELAIADKGFGEIAEAQVGRLAHRKQLSDAMHGNSETQPRLQAQRDFEADGFDVSDLTSPRKWLPKLLDSQAGKWVAGWNEKMADATAKALLSDVSTTAGRSAFAARLREQGLAKEEAQRVVTYVSNLSAGGASSVIR